MGPGLAADLVLLLHLCFILFVGIGGLLVLRWPRLAWVHLPAVLWGALIELHGDIICPLTPLEIMLREAAGQSGYEDGFIGHYLVAIIYPAGLTRAARIGIGILVIVLNLAVYAAVILRRRRPSGGG